MVTGTIRHPTVGRKENELEPTSMGVEDERRVAVMLVTGFLGSGKTTLLNEILNNVDPTTRVAAIVNEIGAVDVDGQLIDGSAGKARSVRLPNGCVCCTMKDDLVQSVKDVLLESHGKAPDYLLIETTGVADPEPIVLILRQKPLVSLCYLDSIITVVDCDNFQESMLSMRCFSNQIKTADVILMNKIDMVKEHQVQQLEDYFYETLRKPRLIRCINCKVSIPLIMNSGNHLSSALHVERAVKCTTPNSPAKEGLHDHNGLCSKQVDHCGIIQENSHLREDGFSSFSILSNAFPSLRGFQAFLSSMPCAVARLKGFVRFSTLEKFLFEVHLCGTRYTSRVCNEESLNNTCKQGTYLVLIGIGLSEKLIQEHIQLLYSGREASPANHLVDEAATFLTSLKSDIRFEGRSAGMQVVFFALSGWFGPRGTITGNDLDALNMHLSHVVGRDAGIFVTTLKDRERVVLCYEFGESSVTAAKLYRAISYSCVDILLEGLLLAQPNQSPKEVVTVQDSEVKALRQEIRF